MEYKDFADIFLVVKGLVRAEKTFNYADRLLRKIYCEISETDESLERLAEYAHETDVRRMLSLEGASDNSTEATEIEQYKQKRDGLLTDKARLIKAKKFAEDDWIAFNRRCRGYKQPFLIRILKPVVSAWDAILGEEYYL